MVAGIQNVLESLTTLILAVEICQVKMTDNKKRRWISGTLLAAVFLLFSAAGGSENDLLINRIMTAGIYIFLVEEPWKRKIIIFVFSHFYIDVIYFPAKSLIRIIEILNNKNFPHKELYVNIVVLFCVVIISIGIRKKENYVRWIRSIPSKYYCWGVLCSFSASGITTFIQMQLEEGNKATQIVLAILAVIINTFLYTAGIAMTIIDLFRKHYKEENILKDEYLRLSNQHYKSLKDNIEEIRGLKHDLRKHMNAVTYLLEQQEWEKLKEYIEAVNGAIDKKTTKIINVNHNFVNAILTGALAGEEDILLQCEGGIPENIIIEEFDLCTIFSNLISNSMEACRQIEGQKRIQLRIQAVQNNMYIRMENPVSQEVNTDKLGKWTSKENKEQHGYGIRNVQMAVEKYDGEITFECKENKFIVELVLLNVLN